MQNKSLTNANSNTFCRVAVHKEPHIKHSTTTTKMAASIASRRLHSILRKTCIRQIYRHLSKSSVVCTANVKDDKQEQMTHFGFKTVTEAEKEEKVYEVFKKCAETYDLMNDAMSAGVHRLWKDRFIKRLSPRPGTQLLDVAGGTGDIAFRFLNYVNSLEGIHTGDRFDISLPEGMGTDLEGSSADSTMYSGNTTKPTAHVTVCDINQAMLDVGKVRAEEAGIYSGISWQQGNAECLPFEDNKFDAYTIAFGIRNCTHVDKVVEEAYRVLKPGGRLMCLEFSHVANPVIRRVYDEYSFQVIPVMGQILAADWNSYQYLVESIRQFPNQEDFKNIIQNCGFQAVSYENLTFGVCAIHSGFKL